MLHRRQFLRQSTLCTAATLAAGAAPFAAQASLHAAQPKTAPDAVVYEGEYPGWPWVTATRDGVLYCVFREGTRHDYSAEGRILLSSSTDGGQTWSVAKTILDEPKVDDRNVAIVELTGGDLLLTYNTYTAAKESLAMTSRSRDGGQTWSPPAPVGELNTRTKSAAAVLQSGALLLPYYIAPGSGAVAARSTDDGQTWQTVRVPDTDGFIGDEWDVLELDPGTLLGVLRNSHSQTDGTFWRSVSTDDGASWSTPQRTNVRSDRYTSPAQLCRQNGRPTLIYADRRMVSVCAVKTNDPDYLEWDVEGRLKCYVYQADEQPIDDGSYPVSAAVGPDERVIVDYEIASGMHRITAYRIQFPLNW